MICDLCGEDRQCCSLPTERRGKPEPTLACVACETRLSKQAKRDRISFLALALAAKDALRKLSAA